MSSLVESIAKTDKEEAAHRCVNLWQEVFISHPVHLSVSRFVCSSVGKNFLHKLKSTKEWIKSKT